MICRKSIDGGKVVKEKKEMFPVDFPYINFEKRILQKRE
jgi:hypothetical protein